MSKIISLTLTSRLAIAVVKEGVCPAVEAGTVGICSNECENDAHCEGSSKCCSNGCGHVCVPALPGELFLVDLNSTSASIFRQKCIAVTSTF